MLAAVTEPETVAVEPAESLSVAGGSTFRAIVVAAPRVPAQVAF
jgi:hypothetical protein